MRVKMVVICSLCVFSGCEQPDGRHGPDVESTDGSLFPEDSSPIDAAPDADLEVDLEADSSGDLDALRPDAREVDLPARDTAADLRPEGPCQQEGVWLCDGFEDPTLDPWSIEEFDGLVTRSDEFVFDGDYALKTEIAGRGARAVASHEVAPSIDSGQPVWLRFWLYNPGENSITGGIEFVRLRNSTDETLVLFMDRDEVDTHAHLTGRDSFEFDHFEGFPIDRWVCVEWGVQLGAENAFVELALDGVTIIREEGLSIEAAEPFDELRIGIAYAPITQYFFELHFDELFLGDFRPGCH